MLSIKNIMIGLLVSLLMGFSGAIPFFILGLFFNASGELFSIAALIIASWLPLKVLIDAYVKEQSEWMKIPDIPLMPVMLILLLFISVASTFIVYFFTATALLTATFLYAFSQNLAVSLLAGLLVQIVMIYRTALREKALGINNRIFSGMQHFSQNSFVIEINPEQMRRQTPREDQAQILYLPQNNLRDHSADTSDDIPMTITLDPKAVSEQSDDEA